MLKFILIFIGINTVLFEFHNFTGLTRPLVLIIVKPDNKRSENITMSCHSKWTKAI